MPAAVTDDALDRTIRVVARGVKSDIERTEASFSSSIGMAVSRWSIPLLQSAQMHLPATQAAAVKGILNEEAFGELHQKLVKQLSEQFASLAQAASKTIRESTMALTKIDDIPVSEEKVPQDPLLGGDDQLRPTATADDRPEPQVPSGNDDHQPAAAEPASPTTAASETTVPVVKHTRKAVKVLIDASTNTRPLEEVIPKPETSVQTTQVGTHNFADYNVETDTRAKRAVRRVIDNIRLRRSLAQMSTAMASAAADRLALTVEVIRLLASAKEASSNLSVDGSVLVARQLHAWRLRMETGDLSEATTATLAALDSDSLRLIAARANGQLTGEGVEALSDALARPSLRKGASPPRARVRTREVSVGVAPADLLVAFPVKDVRLDSAQQQQQRQQRLGDVTPPLPSLADRDLLKSRERARLGASSFFLCRRCGADAREHWFDPQKKKLVPLTARRAPAPPADDLLDFPRGQRDMTTHSRAAMHGAPRATAGAGSHHRQVAASHPHRDGQQHVPHHRTSPPRQRAPFESQFFGQDTALVSSQRSGGAGGEDGGSRKLNVSVNWDAPAALLAGSRSKPPPVDDATGGAQQQQSPSPVGALTRIPAPPTGMVQRVSPTQQHRPPQYGTVDRDGANARVVHDIPGVGQVRVSRRQVI